MVARRTTTTSEVDIKGVAVDRIGLDGGGDAKEPDSQSRDAELAIGPCSSVLEVTTGIQHFEGNEHVRALS